MSLVSWTSCSMPLASVSRTPLASVSRPPDGIPLASRTAERCLSHHLRHAVCLSHHANFVAMALSTWAYFGWWGGNKSCKQFYFDTSSTSLCNAVSSTPWYLGSSQNSNIFTVPPGEVWLLPAPRTYWRSCVRPTQGGVSCPGWSTRARRGEYNRQAAFHLPL